MHLYQNGMPREMLSQWLGHAQLETTLIYAHADTEMKRKAIAEATPADSPLGKHVMPTLMKIENDDLVRRLYGLLRKLLSGKSANALECRVLDQHAFKPMFMGLGRTQTRLRPVSAKPTFLIILIS
jgi:hypothetical protein